MKRNYPSGSKKRIEKRRKDRQLKQVLEKTQSMYDFFNTVQHQALEAAVNNIAECSEINANENCNLETEREIVTVISSSTIVEASVTEKKDIESVNNAEDVIVSEANQSESERIQEKSIAETETQSSVSTISARTSCATSLEAAFANQTEFPIECFIPPDLVNSDRKRYIISQPPGPFPKDQKGRSFSSYHYHFLSANVRIQRQWLCYSSKNNFVYCRYCWLFGNVDDPTYQSFWVTGVTDWPQLSKKIRKHESSPCHLTASITASD